MAIPLKQEKLAQVVNAELLDVNDSPDLEPMNETISYAEQIFLEAIVIESGTDRADFILNACGDDRDLRLQIEAMIAMHGLQGRVLEKTSHSFFETSETVDPIATGTSIGRYKLLQKVGAGGMGVVFMAQQAKPVRRKVAIKIIRHGMDSKNVLARFEAERQALAMMDHPNISRIFDAGATKTGRPYFVMELITGLPVTQFSDQRKLSLRRRLELFQKICHALQHAHEKGIIHRDIKPSNIMVTQFDGVVTPKVIDFGIAKAIDQSLTAETMFTSYGSMVGTPEYMSPEQAELNGLDVDTGSDVYSLGVVLYELMTGTTPFYQYKQSGLRQFCDAICTQEPELASTRVNNLTESMDQITSNRNVAGRELRQFLRGEVDWILAKCLAKQREDRYSTVADLADDIQRFLDGESVSAAATRPSYRLRKYVVRHRWAAMTAVVLAACVLITTAICFAFASRAMKAEKLAYIRLQELQLAQQAAVDERDRALTAEMKIRELERTSQCEAANSQAALVHCLNINQSDRVSTLETLQKTVVSTTCLEKQLPSGENQSYQIDVAEEGPTFLARNNDILSFEFPGCVSLGLRTRYQIQLKAVDCEKLECDERAWVMVTDEL